jgi:hypothetical protein
LRISVRRDGSVEHTRTGQGRHRTEDETLPGVLAPGEFAALVRLLQAHGIAQLDAVHDDPELADGDWASLRLVHPGGERQVWWRSTRRPEAVRELEQALMAIGQRTAAASR